MCLNILREEWRPVLSVQSVLHGLLFLLTAEPSTDDPLNPKAAQALRMDRERFAETARRLVHQGGTADGVRYPACAGG